ncbi:MAG: hypothetical protein KGI54_08785 [Pseudomonadota bacterium]|nr:hypothetical protein [Pseudomonadota bacterium]
MNTLINSSIVVAILSVLSCSYMLDVETREADHIQAKMLDDAIKEERQRVRFELSARKVCGENAGFVDLGNGSIQCKTKRGANTIVATMENFK